MALASLAEPVGRFLCRRHVAVSGPPRVHRPATVGEEGAGVPVNERQRQPQPAIAQAAGPPRKRAEDQEGPPPAVALVTRALSRACGQKPWPTAAALKAEFGLEPKWLRSTNTDTDTDTDTDTHTHTHVPTCML